VPEPSRIDLAVRDVVARVLADYQCGVADVRHEWGEQAGMWSTEVEPRRARAAPLSLSFDGHGLLNVNVGPTWFEVFPFGHDEESLAYLESIVRAVMAGRVEQGGFSSAASRASTLMVAWWTSARPSFVASRNLAFAGAGMGRAYAFPEY